MDNCILKVQNVSKRYAGITAVDGLSFQIRRGEIFALLGPNGAGKTTTARMLTNIIRPDSGEITYFLDDSKPEEFPDPRNIGYLPEDRGLYQDISVIRILEYMGQIRGLRENQSRIAAKEWLETFGLSGRKNEKLGVLSKGNQQKAQFASAVLHRPKFTILDEPFSGLDPLNQEFIINIIKTLTRDGMTVLLSAHQMQLVEKIADRALLINHGRAIISGSVDEIKKSCRTREKLTVRFDDSADDLDFERHEAVDRIEKGNGRAVTLYLKQNASLSSLLSYLAANYRIVSVQSEPITLHDAFLEKITQQDSVR